MDTNVVSLDKPMARRRVWQVRSRLRLSLFITLILILIISLLSSFMLKGKAMEAPDHYLSWDVTEGDTLWSIAGTSLPHRRDIRDYITEIKELNGLQTSNIIAGQQLQIPVYLESSEPDSAVQLGINK